MSWSFFLKIEKINVKNYATMETTFSNLKINKPFSISPQRQLNAEKFLVSPDLNFVVLIADIDEDGAK